VRRTLPDACLTIVQHSPKKASHGRYETRTLWALSSSDLNAYVGSAGTVGEPWPGVSQVCRIQRVRRCKDRKTGEWRTTAEVDYAITSLDRERADAHDLLKYWRVHWHIENCLHWVRDVTFGEDASQVHRGQAPEVFATLRNAAISLLKQFRFSSIAVGKRELQMGPDGVLTHFQTLANVLRANREPFVRPLSGISMGQLATCPTRPSVAPTRSRDRPLVK